MASSSVYAKGRFGEASRAATNEVAEQAFDLMGSAISAADSIELMRSTKQLRTPRGMIGGASPGSSWAADLSYVSIQWLCPPLNDVKAYDAYVSMYGYRQNGNNIDLSGNRYMPRKNFSYIKTMNANINGPLGIYKSAVEAAFNNGIRFWDKSFAAAGTIGSFPDSVIISNTPR